MGSLEGVSKISLILAQEDIPSEFKLEWMNKTLKFIKNDKESILKYPEMPSNRIKFLKAMVAGVSCDAGISYKNLYAPLWEALRIIGLQYEFRMSVQHTKSSHGHLFLEKIPRRQDAIDVGSSELESSFSSNSTPDVRKQTKKQNQVADNKKFVETIKKIIDSISPLFIKNTLYAILEFMSDETQASCVFDNLARVEAQFLQQFLGISKRRTLLEELFSPLCNKLWVKIGDVLDNNKLFKIEVSSVTVDKETAKRCLTLQKVPIFSEKTSKPKSPRKRCKKVTKDRGNENLEPNVVNVRETEDVSSILLKSIENCQNRIEAKTKKDEPTHQKSIEPTEDQNQEAKNNLKRPITDKVVDVSNKTPTESEMGFPRIDCGNNSTELVIDKTVGKKVKPLTKQLPTMSSTPPSIDKKVINTAGLCKRKVKLIEALSTPIESDIGLRMMRSMGWEGGALGAREGGITEPIMPALHLVPKAGLGHEKDEKKKPENNKTRSENRIRILESVLELLKKNLILSYVHFENGLNKREIHFLDNVKVALNKRKLLGVNIKVEIDLVQNILTFLVKNPSVHFNVEALSRMRIKLEKITVPPKQNPAENLKKLIGSDQQVQINKSLIQKRLQVNEPNNESDQPLISTSNPINPSQANQLSNQANHLSNSQSNQLSNSQSSSQTNQPSNSQTNQTSNSQSNQSSFSQETQQSKSLNTLFKTLSNKIANEDMNNNEDEDSFLTNQQILSLLDLKEQLKISKKTLRKLKLRLFIMKSCLDFLKSGQDSVILNYALSVSVQNFLYKLCSFVNNRKADKFAYSIENYVWLEIKQCVGDNYVIAKTDSGAKYFGFSKISVRNNRTLCDVNQNDIVNKEINSQCPTGLENSESIKDLRKEFVKIGNSGVPNSTFVRNDTSNNDDKSTNSSSDINLENTTNIEVKSDTIESNCNKNAYILNGSNSIQNSTVVQNCIDGITGLKNSGSVKDLRKEFVKIGNSGVPNSTFVPNDTSNDDKSTNGSSDINLENTTNIEVKSDTIESNCNKNAYILNGSNSIQNSTVVQNCIDGMTGLENSESIKDLRKEFVKIGHSGVPNSTFVPNDISNDDKSTNGSSDVNLETKTNMEVKSDIIESNCNKNANILNGSNIIQNSTVVQNCTDGTVVKNYDTVQNSNNIFHFGSMNANTDIFNKSENVSDEDRDCFKFSFNEGKINATTSVASDENETVPFTNVRIIQQIGKIMTVETAAKVQNRISDGISPNFLPLLKCHGIKSDSLIYSCYNEKSLDFLKEVLSDFQIVKYEISGSYKMAVTVRYFEGTLKNVFAWLKIYHDFNFERWEILQVTHYDDKMEFAVSMDSDSFDYIRRNNFRLLAGIDEISFDIVV